MIAYYQTLALILFLYMNIFFMISIFKKRNDLADTAWGLGFVILTIASLYISGNYNFRTLLVSILVTVWGLRLAWHIYQRNKGKAEDYRYLAWRNQWGKWFYIRSYLQIYLLQGLLLFIIVFPVLLLIHTNPAQPLSFLDFIGILIWIFGFYFEALGDAQLAKFLKNPENKGKLMQEGLWKYTRHPNYFGEVVQWWGLWLICLSASGNWFSAMGPIMITFLILKVSGIPMLEKKMEDHPDFEEYKKKTSMFIPFRRKNL